MLEVRRVALDRFGQTAIRTGMPLATMEEALVPLYLHHRYQAEATTKVVAGQYYTYAMRGDGQEPLRPVPAVEQRAAVEALVRTLQPAELAIPRSLLEVLPPRPFRYGPHQELFSRNTGLVFDAIAPAAAAADMTLSFLLHPERAARMVQQEALYPDLPGLEEVLRILAEALFEPSFAGAYEAELNRAVERVFVDRTMALSTTAPMPQVRALATRALVELRDRFEEGGAEMDPGNQAHYLLLKQDIERLLERPHEAVQIPDPPVAPPGSPIGEPDMGWLDWRSFGSDGGGWRSSDWWWY
jgi:hypothetical protein